LIDQFQILRSVKGQRVGGEGGVFIFLDQEFHGRVWPGCHGSLIHTVACGRTRRFHREGWENWSDGPPRCTGKCWLHGTCREKRTDR